MHTALEAKLVITAVHEDRDSLSVKSAVTETKHLIGELHK